MRAQTTACACVWLMLWSAVDAKATAAPVESARSRSRPVAMERAQQWNLRSSGGRTFEISLALPKAEPRATGYPVMYVLDADTAFATLVDAVRNQESMLGPAVIVGIGYPSEPEIANRTFDLSPPATDPATLPRFHPQGWGAVGGADAFLAFIQNDLRPQVERLVPVDKNRQALFGHSMGGLFVLYVLFTRPELFDTYIAGSPAIWWGNRVILNELNAFESRLESTRGRRRLLITAGGLERALNPEERRAATARKLIDPDRMVREADIPGNALSLAKRLNSPRIRGLEVSHAIFLDETHSSVIPAYLGRGTHFTLSAWAE